MKDQIIRIGTIRQKAIDKMQAANRHEIKNLESTKKLHKCQKSFIEWLEYQAKLILFGLLKGIELRDLALFHDCFLFNPVLMESKDGESYIGFSNRPAMDVETLKGTDEQFLIKVKLVLEIKVDLPKEFQEGQAFSYLANSYISKEKKRIINEKKETFEEGCKAEKGKKAVAEANKYLAQLETAKVEKEKAREKAKAEAEAKKAEAEAKAKLEAEAKKAEAEAKKAEAEAKKAEAEAKRLEAEANKKQQATQ